MDLQLIFAAINFALFVGLLGFLLRRPVKEFWANRAEALRVRIAQARERRAEAEGVYQRLSDRVARMEQEMAALTERMRQNGTLEKQKILEEAQAHAERLTQATQRIAEQELAKARFRLREVAARLTVDLAEKTIRGDLTPADQDRLVTDYLDRFAAQELPVVAGGRP